MTGVRKILIADEDATLVEMLTEQLERQKYFTTNSTVMGAHALELSKKQLYDAIILGANLPDINGAELCQKMRHNGILTPILILVRSDFDENAILNLEVGASDYIKKPFRMRLLLSKVRTHIRNHERQDEFVLKIGPYNLQPAHNLLLNVVENKNIRLTDKESAILQYLYRAGNRIVNREALLDQVWGYNSAVTTHTLETHVYRLRKKIESDPTCAKILVTESGGYRLVP